MIIPIGHEQRSVRRVPWVTATIFALCVAAFLLTTGADHRCTREASRLIEDIAETYLGNPELVIDPEIEDMLLDGLGVDDNQREVFLRTLQEQAAALPEHAHRVSQDEFDKLVDGFWAAYRGSPLYRLGVVPAHLAPATLVTHQFLHGGWGHLFGNLLFLYLAAPYIEDRWGTLLFAAFYLTSGIVAALFWAIRYPTLDAPLVGASGAIAGVMGAFLICFGMSKIRFFYWFFIIWGTFDAPAWLMLPLWLAMEVASGRLMDVVAQGQGGGGVAHWAHVWGFIFGAATAAVVGYFGIDRRLAPAGTAADREDHDASHVDQAYESHRSGRSDEALATLRAALERNSNDIDAAVALWNICTEVGRSPEAISAMLGVVRQAARTGDDEGLITHWETVLGSSHDLEVEAIMVLRIAETLLRAGRDHALVETLERVRITSEPDTPPRVLGRLATLAVEHETATASELVERALGCQGLAGDLRVQLEAEASRQVEGRDPGPNEQPTGSLVELRPADRLRVVEAVPRELDDSTLVIELGGGQRRLVLTSVVAIAVGAVTDADQRPFLLIDLLLDPPWEGDGDLRIVRMRSPAFNPTSLVGGGDAMASFLELVCRLLAASGAKALPDEVTVRAPSSRSYASIEEYQQEVLGVTG